MAQRPLHAHRRRPRRGPQDGDRPARAAALRLSARVDRYWARFFDIDVARLSEPRVCVTAHAGLSGYAGVWLFRRGASCIVSAPEDRVVALSERLGGCSVAELGDPARVESLLPEATALVGPAFHASLSPACFVARPDPRVRPLGPADAAARERLVAACTPAEWQAGAPSADAGDGFGCFHEGKLLALAALRPLGDSACDPSVVTHPAWRGRGCGGAAVSAAVEQAIAADRLVLYQTLVANTPAVALARSLGFDPYATHLAARLAA